MNAYINIYANTFKYAICIYVYTHIYLCLYLHMYVRVHTYAYIRTERCKKGGFEVRGCHVTVHTYTYTNIRVYSVCIYTCICVQRGARRMASRFVGVPLQ